MVKLFFPSAPVCCILNDPSLSNFGLLSIEAGGASNPGLRNEDGDLLDRHARWWNPTSKRRYIKLRAEDLLSVAEKMGL